MNVKDIKPRLKKIDSRMSELQGKYVSSSTSEDEKYRLSVAYNELALERDKLLIKIEESQRVTKVKPNRSKEQMSFNNGNTGGYLNTTEGVFMPIPNQSLTKELPSGVYTVGITRDGQLFFTKANLNCDTIIDLPSKEFKTLVDETTRFIQPETEQRFKKYGFIYKRSFLLHGAPGMGKTVLVNRLAQEVLSKGGVVLFNTKPELLIPAFSALKSTNPDTLKLAVFEEFDGWLEDYETEFLSILDGEIQADRIIYVATTNYFDNIPKRIIRPGRFSTILKVGAPSLEARVQFLSTKIDDKEEAIAIAKQTEGLSVDELREVVLSTKVFGNSLEETKKRIKESRQ